MADQQIGQLLDTLGVTATRPRESRVDLIRGLSADRMGSKNPGECW